MLKIPQLRLSKPIVIIIFIVIIYALSFFFITYRKAIDKTNYDKDILLLFETANKLGYADANQLNFFRFNGTFGSNEDNTALVFSSTDSIETFSRKINNLGLQPDNDFPTLYGKQFIDQNIMSFINESYNSTLVIVDSNSEYSESPISNSLAPAVTEWPLIINQTGKKISLHVRFAELPDKNLLWKDKLHGTTISGPIVIMWLKR